ncbi:MAG: ABC transporter ATP-binding protein [Magnetococcales bacterium]|nr:ABC transporter ATP-binding protein [Magnetococcales bacterium]
MSKEMLKFTNVKKKFVEKEVLQGIDLTVETGEFFAFVGANGQGKTTLMKGMLDFLHMDGGEIEIAGKSHRSTEARSSLAYLPERFNPPYFLTGRSFLQYMMKLHQRPYHESVVLTMLDHLDLDKAALDKPVRSFSKGMTQKLGLAGCFLSEKPLLLLDEPMSGLDPKARVLLKRQLLRMKQAGYSLFFSTHLLADVEELCDRMAILHNGHLRFVGSPKECRKQFPGQSLEESFINCIDAKPNIF